jgi:glycosyltransferase involved in cell wall biosynthesis
MYNTLKAACSGATAITGVTPDFVEWGVSHANRPPTDLDKAFPFGYSKVIPNKENIEKAEKFWKRYGLSKDNNEFVVCFFGTMSSLFDLKTVIEAARKLKLQKRKFRIVLCGSGKNLTLYKNLAKHCENIVFPGWVGAAEIWTLMRMSSMGLAPYFSIKNFTMNLPNKPIEYLSAGLPIISSLKGVLENLLSNYNCGVTYENSDVDNLVSVLINLYDHPDQLEIMSKNAYALYKDKFIAEKVYDDMINYLELVVKNYKKN